MTLKIKQFVLLLLVMFSLTAGSVTPVFASGSSSADAGSQITDDTGSADGQEEEVPLQILDLAGLLPVESYFTLEAQAEALSGQYGCKVYVLTTDTDMSDSTPTELADLFFAQYASGEGNGSDGILLVVKPDTREYALRANGSSAEYAFDDYGQKELENAFLPAFREDRWEDGITGYISTCGDFLQKAAEGHPVRKSPAGTIAVCIAVSCLVSLAICLILRRNMKSVHIGSEANAYAVGGIHLSEQYDRFTHKTETRTKIEKDTSKSAASGRSGTF